MRQTGCGDGVRRGVNSRARGRRPAAAHRGLLGLPPGHDLAGQLLASRLVPPPALAPIPSPGLGWGIPVVLVGGDGGYILIYLLSISPAPLKLAKSAGH